MNIYNFVFYYSNRSNCLEKYYFKKEKKDIDSIQFFKLIDIKMLRKIETEESSGMEFNFKKQKLC